MYDSRLKEKPTLVVLIMAKQHWIKSNGHVSVNKLPGKLEIDGNVLRVTKAFHRSLKQRYARWLTSSIPTRVRGKKKERDSPFQHCIAGLASENADVNTWGAWGVRRPGQSCPNLPRQDPLLQKHQQSLRANHANQTDDSNEKSSVSTTPRRVGRCLTGQHTVSARKHAGKIHPDDDAHTHPHPVRTAGGRRPAGTWTFGGEGKLGVSCCCSLRLLSAISKRKRNL